LVSPGPLGDVPPRFVRGVEDLDLVLRDVKLWRCPHCRRFGTLIGHGLLFGYAEHGSEREVRGRRLLCSSHGKRGGCGRTFSVRLGSMLTGFCARTWTLSRLWIAVVAGLCINAAWTQHVGSSLSLRSGYRLWHRLLSAQSHLRTTLLATGPPPHCADPHPMSQLLAHLHHALGLAQPSDTCVLSLFQLRFQCSVLG
jgi:hypothetical protein